MIPQRHLRSDIGLRPAQADEGVGEQGLWRFRQRAVSIEAYQVVSACYTETEKPLLASFGK